MEGRALNQIGAHAKQPANSRSIWVCLLGNYEAVMPPKAQMDSLIAVLIYLCKRFGINASNIIGHRDAPNNATSCPGNQFYHGTRSLSIIRAAVRQALTEKPKTQLSPKQQQEEDDKTLWRWIQRFWDAAKELDNIPRAAEFETWGPYVPLGFNARMRQGVFRYYKVGSADPWVRGIYRSERTTFDSQNETELRNILQDRLSELVGDGETVVLSRELPNIGEVLRKSSLVPVDHKIEFEINPIAQTVTLRHIATFKDIVLSKNRSVSIDLVIEIEVDNKPWFFPPAVVTAPGTVGVEEPKDISSRVRVWTPQVNPSDLIHAVFIVAAIGLTIVAVTTLPGSVSAAAALALILKNK